MVLQYLFKNTLLSYVEEITFRSFSGPYDSIARKAREDVAERLVVLQNTFIYTQLEKLVFGKSRLLSCLKLSLLVLCHLFQ